MKISGVNRGLSSGQSDYLCAICVPQGKTWLDIEPEHSQPRSLLGTVLQIRDQGVATLDFSDPAATKAVLRRL